MANEYAVNHADLKAVAKAIRDKGKTTEALTFPVDFISAVEAISGVELNFEVVGGTEQPVNPKENTVWVNTETEITGYTFSSSQPSASEGHVWISTEKKSTAEFNALKNDALYVYPALCKQHTNGNWVAVNILIYQSGTWILPRNVLLGGGKNELGTPTFSAEIIQSGASLANTQFTANGDGTFTVAGKVNNGWGNIEADFPNAIDANNYSTLTAIVKLDSASSMISSASTAILVGSAPRTDSASLVTFTGSSAKDVYCTFTLDVSAFTTLYITVAGYMGHNNNFSLTFQSIELA